MNTAAPRLLFERGRVTWRCRYTPAAFRLSRILDPRPNAEFNAKYPFCNVLPSPVSPSDHVLIAAEFDLVGR